MSTSPLEVEVWILSCTSDGSLYHRGCWMHYLHAFCWAQTLPTELLCQTDGMVTDEEWHHSTMQLLLNGTYCRQPLDVIWTTYIIPISTIQGVVHHLPLTPQSDTTQWYLTNTIDFNAFNCVTCRWFNSILELMAAAIDRHPMCLLWVFTFGYGSFLSLCIIDILRD
jgi:hypothetical protein